MLPLDQQPLVKVLRRLGLPAEDFAVFGSGPLVAHGIGEISDLDLVARGQAWHKAREMGELSMAPSGTRRLLLAGGDIEIFDRWFPGAGWNIDDLIDGADVVSGIRFVALQEVLAWKRAMKREKDSEHIRLIEAHLSGPAALDCQVCVSRRAVAR